MENTDKGNDIGTVILDAAFKVHRSIGPGLLESVYEKCMIIELKKRGLSVETQVPVSFEYDGMLLDGGLRLDLRVQSQVIVEIKSVEALLAIHQAQLLTYLKLSKLRLGYLINFNEMMLKHGIKRLVHSTLKT